MTHPFVPFVERVYERRSAGGETPVRLRLDAPEPDPPPGMDWRCRVRVDGLPRTIDQYAHGIDPLQALALGLDMARSYLETAPLDPGEALTWLGRPDLGIPRTLPDRRAAGAPPTPDAA